MRNLYFLFTLLFLFSCEKTTSMQPADQTSTAVVQDTLEHGVFVNTDAHQLSGDAVVYQLSNGRLLLSLEKLSVLGGPDVDIYLSDANGYKNANVIHCGHLEGEDGEQITGVLTFLIPENVEPARYPYVIFWCKRYSVLFGYAKLQ